MPRPLSSPMPPTTPPAMAPTGALLEEEPEELLASGLLLLATALDDDVLVPHAGSAAGQGPGLLQNVVCRCGRREPSVGGSTCARSRATRAPSTSAAAGICARAAPPPL